MAEHSIEQLILKKARKESLSESESAQLAEWGGRSAYHQELLDEVGDEVWVKEGLRRKCMIFLMRKMRRISWAVWNGKDSGGSFLSDGLA